MKMKGNKERDKENIFEYTSLSFPHPIHIPLSFALISLFILTEESRKRKVKENTKYLNAFS